MCNVNIIVAMSNNKVIGVDGELPWHLPSDLKRFKELTTSNEVVMGRKCFESLPSKFRPLPNRINYVLSKSPKDIQGAIVINDFDSFIAKIKDNKCNCDIQLFIIGGGEIYKQGFKHASKIYLTRILSNFKGDVFLDGFDETQWLLTNTSEEFEENGLKFRFEEYVKNV